MKKLLVLLFCFLFFSGARQVGQFEQAQKHFLWKVSKANSHVWILGSIHMADSSFYPLPSVIMNAFKESSALVVEMDVSDDSVLNELTSISNDLGLLPSGQKLKDVIPDSTYSHVDSLLSSWGLTIEFSENYRPWMAAMQISAIAIQKTGFSSDWGIDFYLMDEALEQGKEIISLETPATQIEALATPSDALGTYYLQSTLKEVAQIDEMIQKISSAWKTGNDTLLRTLLNPKEDQKSEEMKKALNQKIYLERNLMMADRIELFLNNEQRYFIVIGAGHLIGEEDNILQLLGQKGFQVEQY